MATTTQRLLPLVVLPLSGQKGTRDSTGIETVRNHDAVLVWRREAARDAGRTRHAERGFGLLATAACLTVMIGMLGLTVDLGRMYVVKNEVQTFVDAAALAAALELDGTSAGLARAAAAATTGPPGTPNRWYFSTKGVTGVTHSFGQTPGGVFSASPASALGYRFVRVTAAAGVPLYFLPVLPGVGTSTDVSSTAVAGQGLTNSLGEGMAPFSPDAHSPGDPEFGFARGEYYSLKWPPPGHRKKGDVCPGDEDFTPGGGSSDRGYIDVGQGNGSSALRDTIVNGNYYLASPLTIGSSIDTVPGNKGKIGEALAERFEQDTDTSSPTYASYSGNGRRLLVVPVNDGSDTGVVVGFAAFFLPPDACGDKNTSPCCAEYIGPAVLNGPGRGGAASGGLFQVMLFK